MELKIIQQVNNRYKQIICLDNCKVTLEVTKHYLILRMKVSEDLDIIINHSINTTKEMQTVI